jgi:hypothetical protein
MRNSGVVLQNSVVPVIFRIDGIIFRKKNP